MNQHDFIKSLIKLVEGTDQKPALTEAKAPDLAKAGQKAIKNMKAAEKEKKAKAEKEKASNVKESGAEFFRKYSDIIKEAEEKRWDEKEWEDEDGEDDRWKDNPDDKEDLEEGKLDDLNDKRAAEKAEKGEDDGKKSPVRKVAGKQYGGSKQKDDQDEE